MGKYKTQLIGLFGILVSVASIVYLMQKVDFSAAFAAMGKINWAYPLLMVAIYLTSFLVRTWRWQLMLSNFPDISFAKFFNSLIIGFAGNNLVPARGGEVIRMLYFSRETKVNKFTSMSSVLTEKILDGLALVMLLVLSIWLAGDQLAANDWLENTTYLVTAIFLGGIAGLIVLRMVGMPLINWARAKEGVFAKMADIAEKILHATEFLKADFKSVLVILFSLLVWTIEGVVFALGIMAFDLPVDPWIAGFLTLTVVNFGLLVPSSPGYVGVFQMLSAMALGLFGIADEPAIAVSLVVHACQFVPITTWGVIIILRQSVSLFGKSEPTEPSPEWPAQEPIR
jgi:glycosyltransferase 2 family protein